VPPAEGRAGVPRSRSAAHWILPVTVFGSERTISGVGSTAGGYADTHGRGSVGIDQFLGLLDGFR
jgi:hypothetical protein